MRIIGVAGILISVLSGTMLLYSFHMEPWPLKGLYVISIYLSLVNFKVFINLPNDRIARRLQLLKLAWISGFLPIMLVAKLALWANWVFITLGSIWILSLSIWIYATIKYSAFKLLSSTNRWWIDGESTTIRGDVCRSVLDKENTDSAYLKKKKYK